MDTPAIQRALLSQYGLRIDPAMGEYVAKNLSAATPFPVIGGDARTGIPSRINIDPVLINSKLATGGAPINTD